MDTSMIIALSVGVGLLGIGLGLVNWFFPAQVSQGAYRRQRSGLSAALRGRQGRRLGIEALIGLGAGLGVAALSGWIVFILVMPVIVMVIPRLFSDREEKTNTAMLVDLEAWTRGMSGVISSGRTTLVATLRASRRSAKGAMEAPVRQMLARISGGWDTEKALRAFGTELNDSTVDLVVMNLIAAARNPGDGLKDALDGLAELVADDVNKRRAISTERSKPRMNARIVVFLTAVLIIAIPFVPTLAEGYRNPLGQLLFLVVLGVIGLIIWRMQMIVRPVKPARIIVEEVQA
ncbi:MAG: type II secretion system F family protein [Galactobacter sp.]